MKEKGEKMAAKRLVSYRCEKRHHEKEVYGMSIENDVMSFLRSIKDLDGEEYIILNVALLAEEEATEILEMKLNSF